jgi:hypothetical protein
MPSSGPRCSNRGRAVLFFWHATDKDESYWGATRSWFDPDHNVLWMADGDDSTFPSGDAWEGISPYAHCLES